MGLLDKAKQQAQELKGKVEGQAQELKTKVEDKVEDVQQQRKASELLEQLGRLVYAQRTERATPSDDMDSVIKELRTLEDAGATVLASPQVTPSSPPNE
jgi:hypothetical protein